MPCRACSTFRAALLLPGKQGKRQAEKHQAASNTGHRNDSSLVRHRQTVRWAEQRRHKAFSCCVLHQALQVRSFNCLKGMLCIDTHALQSGIDSISPLLSWVRERGTRWHSIDG